MTTAFNNVERSRDSGRPVELYAFEFGTMGYFYTNAERDITAGGLYRSTPIYRDAHKASGKTDKSTVNIRLPITTDLAALFLAYPPTEPVRVTIRAGHLQVGAGEWPVVWLGRVLSSAREGSQSILTCESTIVSLKRPGLRRHYQYGCPFVLYGGQCGANIAAATREAVIAEIVGGGLLFESGWNEGTPIEKFSGGILRWTSSLGLESRAILRAAADRIEFVGPIRELKVGDRVNVILGCNHKTDDCRNLHNNVVNYGGQPWIPLKNPAKYHPFW